MIYSLLRMYLFLILFLLFPFSPLISQTSYIRTDTALYSGMRLIAGNAKKNARMIIHDQDTALVKYTASDIKGYGLANGKEYVSAEVLTKNAPTLVFLERIEDGELSLYYYRGRNTHRFFIQKQTLPWVEIERAGSQQARQILKEYLLDCDKAMRYFRFSPTRKKAFGRAVHIFNNCEQEYFNFPKLRFETGVVYNKLTLPSENNDQYLSQAVLPAYRSLFAGLSFEVPYLSGKFAATSGIYYSTGWYYQSVTSQLANTEADIIIDQATISMPLMIRFYIGNKRLRPYLNAGGHFQYNFRNTNGIFESKIAEGIVRINKNNTNDIISVYAAGIAAGTGLLYQIGIKQTISFEAKYQSGFGAKSTLRKEQWWFSIGFSI